MITVDIKKCRKCGICINRYNGYCIYEKNGIPKFDYSVCNLCQKCVSICPHQAILVNRIKPKKINGKLKVKPDDLIELFSRRRSIKLFKDKRIPYGILKSIADSAKYAPNQNKNIEVVVINDREIINFIDAVTLAFVKRIYRLLFAIKPLALFFQLFSASLHVIKKKMEFDLYVNKHIVKRNTQALILLIGNTKMPVTESSAPYLFGNMIIYGESLGVGTCLMDSLKISLNNNSKLRKRLGINKNLKVLGVLSLGYSDENIINIPQGYNLNIMWNDKK